MMQLARSSRAGTVATRAFDRWFEPLIFNGTRVQKHYPLGTNLVSDNTFPIDVTETDGTLSVTAELPGINKSDIRIEIEDNYLQIEASIDDKLKDEDEGYLLRERRTGSFKRTLKLPVEVDTANSSSDYKNGILKITLPKEETAKSKQIPVN